MLLKIVNKRNFLIINGAIMILMAIIWLLHLINESPELGLMFYNIRDYAELAIVVLLGVMIIDLIKPKKVAGSLIFLISVFIGIVVANNNIDLFKFSSVNEEWLFRSIAFITIYIALIIIFVVEIDLKNIKNYKVEILVIICLVGIIPSWIFNAYKATNHISPKQVEDYFRLGIYILNINRMSTALCGVGFTILGLRKSKI